MAIDPHADGPAAASRTATLSAAQLAVAVRRARMDAGNSAALLQADPIAIVGIGCRFPGGASHPIANLEDYGEFLAAGRSGIREMPRGRWEEARQTLAPYQLLGGYLDGIDLFDAEFFGIAPKEAHTIDPQQRILLEVCWEALSDAAIAPSSLSGSDTGVFAAIYSSDYARLQLHEDAVFDSHTGVGAAHSVAAGRLSFLLNLRGPSMAVDTACSSSLVATHLACQSLRKQECSTAIVAGSSLKLLADEVRAFAQWGMLAHDGCAKTFDASADGFVPGEGCAVIVLKRLSDAVAQGDAIHAVIRGTAVNHDGRSSVLTAPNGPAQEAVMHAALRDAQVAAQEITFVETHGTGTSLGDPIEVEALDAVYGTGSEACALGAVKTNFGHLEAAAGLAGLIKTVVALEAQRIPVNLHFRQLNPQIVLSPTSRLVFANASQSWPRGAKPRFAAVSSFGLGGTNAHIIVEEAPLLPERSSVSLFSGQAAIESCLPISAHTDFALRTLAQKYVEALRLPGTRLDRLARAAARGRDHGDFRIAVSGSSSDAVAEKLEERTARLDFDPMQRQIESADGRGKIAFVFSGQGSLWPGVLENLLQGFPEVERTLSICERIIQETEGWSLRAAAGDARQLEDTARAQPVLFVVQVILTEIMRHLGITPDALTGHSVGEIAAAVAAGVLAVEDGMRLVLIRGRHMSGSLPGRMLSAELSEEEARTLLSSFNSNRLDRIDLAAINAPRSLVFSGPEPAIEELEAQLQAQRVPIRRLEIAYAFHSGSMEASAQAFKDELESAALFSGEKGARSPGIALGSTVTGKPWAATDGTADYWSRGIREPVRFREAIAELMAMGCRTVVEIGPHPVLLRPIAACAEFAGIKHGLALVASMRRGQSARSTIVAALGSLYEQGAKVDWKRVYPGQLQRTKLPAYPWERNRYWLADKLPKVSIVDGATSRRPSAKEPPAIALSSLLGSLLSSPFVDGTIWETVLATDTTPWLKEHCWHGRPIFPFAAWLEIARQAAVASSKAHPDAVVLREFAVSQRLELGDLPTRLQTFAGASRELKLQARSDGDWHPFASGYWDLVDNASAEAPLDLSTIRSRITHVQPMNALYDHLEQSGLTYGTSFRLLRSVEAGIGFALGEVEDLQHWQGEDAGIHPCILDACLQSLQAIQPEEDRAAVLLPVSVTSYQWLGSGYPAYVLAEIVSEPSSLPGADTSADLSIFSKDRRCIAAIRGLRIRRVAAEVASGPMRASMWQLNWQEGAGNEQPAANRRVLSGEILSGGFLEVAAKLRSLIGQERSQPGSIQTLPLTTRGAFSVIPGERTDPEQRALAGLVRSLRAEYPGIAVRVLDRPLGSAIDEPLSREAAEWLCAYSNESAEAVLRSGKILLPRLEPFAANDAVLASTELKIATSGLLDTLQEEPCNTERPAPDEIQIACLAHGLNFRDVLTAMGTYVGTTAAFGAECSGIVAVAGSRSGFTAGDAVVAFAAGSMRSRVNVKASYAMHMPSAMTFAEAATIPVAFLTAHYGFSRLAHLSSGQTVLIHSAAGGLGMAAVQLARLTGATILATAGTDEKRKLLHEQGIEHVFDSRSEQFAEDVLRVTGGQGVDVVLNALSGDKVSAGFRALKRGGAFLEVGKRDIWTRERVSAERPDARYWAFDLGEVAHQQPELIGTMLGELMEWINRRSLTPLPMEIYSVADAEYAFRKMAGGRHVGKLVLTRVEQPLSGEKWTDAISHGTTLISGGTGALGVATARWLLEQGAYRVVLLSRNGSSVSASRLQDEFPERVSLEQADVTHSERLHEVLAAIRSRSDAPLTVIMHAAGEVHDQLLADQTEDSLREAMRTKVAGARLLGELTTADPVQITIYFSSAASMLGSAGQAAYAAANATLDAMAEQRSACGMRTLSVQWGAWAASDSGEGMFAHLSEASVSRALRQGVQPMLPAPALAALKRAILSGKPSVMIAEVDWQIYGNQFPFGTAAFGFFKELLPGRSRKPSTAAIDAVATNPDVSEIAEIRKAPRADRLPRMEALVRSSARKVLGLSASRPMPGETPLQDLGLDSLMALELRNVLAQACERPLSATLLFDYSTIRGLASYLLSLVVSETSESARSSMDRDRENDRYSSEIIEDAELEAMTDAEAEELLLAELNQEAPR